MTLSRRIHRAYRLSNSESIVYLALVVEDGSPIYKLIQEYRQELSTVRNFTSLADALLFLDRMVSIAPQEGWTVKELDPPQIGEKQSLRYRRVRL